MNKSIAPVDIVIFSAVFQGLLLSAYCFIRRKHKSHLYLSLFLGGLSTQLLLSSQAGLRWLVLFPLSVPILDSIPFLLSPLIYFYIYYSFYRSYEPNVPPIYHGIPAALNTLFLLIMYILQAHDGFRISVENVVTGNPPVFIMVTLFLKLLSGLVYVYLIIRMILIYKQELKEWSGDKKKRRWILWLISSFSATWAAVIILGILSNTFEVTAQRLFLYSLIQALFFIWLIYMITGFALNYPALFENSRVRDKIREKLNLSDSRIDQLLSDLNRLMEEEEAFTDPDITLGSLAEEMDIHENILSFIINEKSPGNFSRFINSYRISKFISLAQKMDSQRDTFLTMAFTAGFNSKSSFNRIFKESTGLTPTEYLKKN